MLHLVQKLLRKRRIEERDPMASACGIEQPKFPQFAELNEDICRLILSYIADAPLEQKFPGPIRNGYRPAALTTSLPLVNKAFNEMSNLDSFWRPALLRQLKKEDTNHLWKGGLRRLLPAEFKINEEDDLIDVVRKHIGHSVSYREIYKKVVTHHIRIEAPVFTMPCQLKLGEIFGLHLFEPRYRIMVRDLMDKCENPEEATSGGKIREGRRDGVLEPPLLIHACLATRLQPGKMACLVQVVWCRTYEYGTADVQLVPIAWVKLGNSWVKPSSGHLMYGKASRI
jgi:hypothetical protein